jgi:Predicted transcriptional regulators
MNVRNIGTVIYSLRKIKGITQEELANQVGVSTQAVSKWECGGMPDIELIPAIADYFDVSIDMLFGREEYDYKSADLYAVLTKKISELPGEERINEAFKLLWAIQNAIANMDEPVKLSEVCENNKNQAYSKIFTDNGITMFDLSKKSPYALIMPESDGRLEKLLSVDYKALFKELSEQDTYSLINKPEFIAMLSFAYELIVEPNNFYIYYGNGSKI